MLIFIFIVFSNVATDVQMAESEGTQKHEPPPASTASDNSLLGIQFLMVF
jgi:hypothetical protein